MKVRRLVYPLLCMLTATVGAQSPAKPAGSGGSRRRPPRAGSGSARP